MGYKTILDKEEFTYEELYVVPCCVWWAVQALNLRPPGYEPGTLTS